MHLQRPGTIDVSAPATRSNRIVSVDLLRGLVMILMALDHTRDYVSNLAFPPEDLSKTFGTFFFTRIITHVCAPVFFLLAGAGAYLSVAQGKSLSRLSRFFLDTRSLVSVSRADRSALCVEFYLCLCPARASALGVGLVDGRNGADS
jgi:uncharacterized membrane protein